MKPTEACNFSCTFCSSTKIADSKAQILDLDLVSRFLERFPETRTIIVNGGDPTMVPVSYYWDLIRRLDSLNSKANISITTNLWKFWLEWQNESLEKRWTELFRSPRVNVTTSFQYGESRRITRSRVFSEQDFVRISDLFLEKIGYRPSFISVVERAELHLALENVRLAQRLGVDCKLNYANMSGDCGSPLPLSEIYRIYLLIWKEGLQNHEWNSRQMVNRLSMRENTTCPLSRNCDEGIRVLQPNGGYYSCGAFGDDGLFPVDFETEVLKGGFERPLQNEVALHSLKTECYSCEMFQVCNGCKKHVHDLKAQDLVERHCSQMKEIAREMLTLAEHRQIEIKNDTYFRSSGFQLERSEVETDREVSPWR